MQSYDCVYLMDMWIPPGIFLPVGFLALHGFCGVQFSRRYIVIPARLSEHVQGACSQKEVGEDRAYAEGFKETPVTALWWLHAAEEPRSDHCFFRNLKRTSRVS